MKLHPMQVCTIRKSIIPDNRRAIVANVGAGLYLILKAETNQKQLKPTAPFTLFLRREDFVPTFWKGEGDGESATRAHGKVENTNKSH